MKYLLMLTLLLAEYLTASPAISQASTPSATATASIRTVGLNRPACPPGLSDEQNRIIDAALRRFEKMKPAYAELRRANLGYKAVLQKDSILLAGDKRLIDWYKLAYGQEQGQRQSKDAEVVTLKKKVRKRGWIIGITYGVPAGYGAYKGVQAIMSLFK